MIHKTAIIDPKAKLHSSVKIGPYSIVGPNVEIDENTEVQSHVSIVGNTKIGKNNKIYSFASIGSDPQDLKFQGEETKLEIGSDNKIREYVTINPGTNGGGGVTKVGNKCLFMVSAHIAHDCFVGNNVILANSVPLGGHAYIEDNVIIGCGASILGPINIGSCARVGANTVVLKDVPPYATMVGNPVKNININKDTSFNPYGVRDIDDSK